MISLTDKDGNSYGDSSIVVIGANGKVKPVSTGGGSPTGPAGGDLSGTYPNPSVVWNNGIPTYNSLYFPIPTGTTVQYIRGDGSLATFPAIPAQYNPTAGTGISITGAYPNQTITNTLPDQTVALTAGTGIGITGTYPNFTITNSSPSSGGTVTAVTGSAPLSSTGGTTPNLSIPQSSTLQDGYLSSTDWNTFNGKQNALTLTTTGTSGAATLVGSTLNIPQYSGGGGASGGFNTPVKLGSGSIYSNIPYGASNATVALGSNTMYLAPFIPAQTFTISDFLINVAVLGSGNYRILLYSHNDTNGLPDVLLYESTDLSVTTTGVKTAITTQTFTAGTTYWLGVYGSGAAQFAAVVVASQNQIGMYSTLAQYSSITRGITFGSAPNPFGITHSKSSASFIRIGLTVA